MRRLNQAEYQNTVCDLLGVDVDLKDILPVDLAAGGFDTTAETLHMSSYQLNGYLAAANRVLEAAVAGGPRPNQVKRRIDVKNEAATRRYDVYRHLDDGVAIFSGGNIRPCGRMGNETPGVGRRLCDPFPFSSVSLLNTVVSPLQPVCL